MSAAPHFNDSWAVEKVSNVTEYLSEVRDLLAKPDRLTLDLEEVDVLVSGAIYDASKVLAFVTSSQWSTDDASDIQAHGKAGYERVAVKYGVITQTEEDERNLAFENFVDSLSKLIEGDRSPNRTFVHELLGKTTIEHPLVEKTARIIEMVTQGQLDWKDFTSIMRGEIRELMT